MPMCFVLFCKEICKWMPTDKKKKVYVVYFPIKYQYYNTRERSLNKQAAVYDQRMHSNGELHLC